MVDGKIGPVDLAKSTGVGRMGTPPGAGVEDAETRNHLTGNQKTLAVNGPVRGTDNRTNQPGTG